MNKKAFELAISTLILIILGIIVLIGIIIAVRGGFENLKGGTKPFTDSTQATAIRNSCLNDCRNNVKITYCCSEYQLGEEKIKCSDPRLELDCTLDCTDFPCE